MPRPLADALADVSCPVIGMVHLPPLPGSPRYEPAGPGGGGRAAIREAAVRDAVALRSGGAHAVMVENFGDVPFFKDAVGPHTVAEMTAVVSAVVAATGLPVGVNVLRNGAAAAVAVAAAAGAAFVRVNVLAGAAVTDQGVIEGRAAEVMRARAAHDAAHVRVLADVAVKHAAPLVPRPIAEQVAELTGRALADAVIVTGPATGSPVDMDELRAVKAAAGGAAVLVGSGVTAATAAALAEIADGLIVGTSVKRDGQLGRPVDPPRVRAVVDAAGAGRG